jgi:hypothetical protein
MTRAAVCLQVRLTPPCENARLRAKSHVVTRTCIVHFGLHKTGTTSIQRALFDRLPRLDAGHVHLGSPFIGRDLLAAFCADPARIAPDLGQVSAAQRESLRDAFRKAIHALPHHRVVISAEDISRFDTGELERFVDFLRSQGFVLKAVAYVRECHDWYESILQQAAKYGTWRQTLFPLSFSAYRQPIETFDRLLGRGNVHLWKYERARFPRGCVVHDFFQRLQLGQPGSVMPEENVGLGIDAVRLLRAFHRNGLRTVVDRESFDRNVRLANHMTGLQGPRVKLDPAIVQERLATEAADVEWIEQRLGQSLRRVPNSPATRETIRSEADLDRWSQASLRWLERESGTRVRVGADCRETSHTVARAMATLQDRLCTTPQPAQIRPHPRGEMRRIIWMSWFQGESNAPTVVRRCIASWRELNPGWEVKVLDSQMAEPFLQRSSVPRLRLAAMPPEKNANVLRMRLLTEEGGVWADATTYCLRPLDEWLPACMAAGFFCFRDPGPDRLVANWFLASERGGRLATLWQDAHEAFWRDRDYLHHSSYDAREADLPFLQRTLLQVLHKALDRNTRHTDLWFHPLVRAVLRTYPYCVMHYLFARGCRRQPEWAELFARMPWHDAEPLLQACRIPPRTASLEEVIESGRTAGLPMMKLDWRTRWLDDQPGS